MVITHLSLLPITGYMYNFTSSFVPQKFLANVNLSRIWWEALIGWGNTLSANVYKWPPCQQNFCLAYSILVYSRKTLHERHVRSCRAWVAFLAYSFEPRPNNHMLAIVSFFMTIGLSINRQTQTRKNQFDERKQDWLVQKFGDFKSLTWFRQSLLLSSSFKKTKGCSALGQNIKM